MLETVRDIGRPDVADAQNRDAILGADTVLELVTKADARGSEGIQRSIPIAIIVCIDPGLWHELTARVQIKGGDDPRNGETGIDSAAAGKRKYLLTGSVEADGLPFDAAVDTNTEQLSPTEEVAMAPID